MNNYDKLKKNIHLKGLNKYAKKSQAYDKKYFYTIMFCYNFKCY